MFTEKELQIIKQLISQASVQGLDSMRMILTIDAKLSNLLEEASEDVK